MNRESKTTSPMSETDRAALHALIAASGERSALRAVGLSRMGAYRALAGLPVTLGTRVLVRTALRRAASSESAGS